MKSMKCLVFIAALCVGIINSVPVHNGIRYYRAPSSYSGYYRPYPMHQTMLLHYNNPYSARTSQASEITAFASGDQIGTGTYYEHEPAQEFQPPPPSPPKLATDLNQDSSDESSGNAISIAESYPEADESSETEQHQEENEVHFVPNPTISYEPLPQKHNVAPTATPATPLIAKPPAINVEIESNEGDDDDAPIDAKKQQQPSSQGSWPLNNFFPITFGGSPSGGSIAIANSFSTGKGGTAVSRATAYGSSSKGKLGKQLNH